MAVSSLECRLVKAGLLLLHLNTEVQQKAFQMEVCAYSWHILLFCPFQFMAL